MQYSIAIIYNTQNTSTTLYIQETINLDEVLSKNVNKREDLLTTSGLWMFPPDKKFLNVFFMRNKA